MQLKKDYWNLAGAAILLVLGFSILRSPVSLEKQTMRLIGILLIMQAVRGYTDPFAAHDQVTSTLLTIAGAVLLLMPLGGIPVCGGTVRHCGAAHWHRQCA